MKFTGLISDCFSKTKPVPQSLPKPVETNIGFSSYFSLVYNAVNAERAFKLSLRCSACQSNIPKEGEWTHLIGSLGTVLF